MRSTVFNTDKSYREMDAEATSLDLPLMAFTAFSAFTIIGPIELRIVECSKSAIDFYILLYDELSARLMQI